jgi:Bacterial PH domain
MTIESRGHEYEFEPQYGLPERLPQGERLIWQGSPDVGTLARRVFHLRKLALYFVLLLAARAAMALNSGAGWFEAAMSIKWFAPLAIAGLASVGVLAWLTARTTVYTLTDKRVVMRVGIVLTVAFNLPLRQIESAALRGGEGGFGDITLALAGRDRIAWLQLWPSVRPWRFTQPEPMLRAIPNAQAVAEQLMAAWSASTGVAATPATTTAASPERAPHWQTSPT